MPTTIIADRRINGSKIDDQHSRIKGNIKDSYEYFRDNYERYYKFLNFQYKTSLSSADVDLNKRLGRPQLEFNLMEAKISRLLGEFVKQEPGIMVGASDLSLYPADPALIKILEGYFRYLFDQARQDNTAYKIYDDMISGGFGVFKVGTDYVNENSFDQNINISRAFDPTLVGFDKMAVEPHKGDGMFCFECFPRSREEFESEYGTKYTKDMKFTRSFKQYDFNWSYVNDQKQVVMIVDYWEKKISKAKIVRLASGDVMTEDEYEKLKQNWDQLIQVPVVVGKPRKTDIITIARHRMIENETLEYVETDYKYLPLVFADGNSKMLRNAQGKGSARQMTRPLMYNMVGLQKLKNFIGIMIANHIENTPQSQWLAPVESIPAEYKDFWINPQTAGTLFYNQYKDDDVSIPLNPPREVNAPQLPPGFLQIFAGLDDLSQTILGSFDSALGINDNQLSGKAIYNGAIQSNAATSPYLVGYICALNRVAEIVLDLIPKYMDTPRNLNLRDSNGKKTQQLVNVENGVSLKYDPLSLKVKVEAGINFELQRQQAFTMLMNLMDKVPPIQQFITTKEAGIEMLLDNLEIRGIDALKADIKPFLQELNQQNQMAMQAQQQQAIIQQQELQSQQQIVQQQLASQQQIEQWRLALKAQSEEMQNLIDQAKLQVEQYKAETARIEVVEKADESAAKALLKHDEIQAEQARTAIDAIQTAAETTHKHTMDMLNFGSSKNNKLKGDN